MALLPIARPRAALSPLLRARDALLDRWSGAAGTAVLNAGPAAPLPPGTDPAAGLRAALNRLRAAAMNEAGTAVAYAALRDSSAYAALRGPLAALRDFAPLALPGAAAQRAFWLNLYNVLVLDGVIQLAVAQSVTAGRRGALAFFRRAAYAVDGRRLSLDDIEHGILRGNRGHPYIPGPHFALNDPRRVYALPLDPRIHFALNCGAVSCPPIRAYAAAQLDDQLDLAARAYLDGGVQVDAAAGVVALPALLKWYAGDFGGPHGVRTFVRAHLPADGRRAYLAQAASPRLVYTPYDWSLNVL